MSKMTRLLKVPNKFQSLFNTWGAGEWKNKPAISDDPQAETGEGDGKKNFITFTVEDGILLPR